MLRVSVLALVAIASVLLATPAQGQSAEEIEIEEQIAKLSHQHEDVRRRAAKVLGYYGSWPEVEAAVPALITALSDVHEPVRASATWSLGRMGPKAARAVPALIGRLSDEARGRSPVGPAWALGRIGPPAVPALIVALSDEDAGVRRHAVRALSQIGPGAAPAVPALIAVLSDEDGAVRWEAATALGRIGPKAAPAVPALIETLSDRVIWGAVIGALQNIGISLKKRGTVLWWVVPRVYWRELVALLILLVGWFVLMARLPKYRPASNPKHLALMAITVAVPVTFACPAVLYAITRWWLQGFLPDTLTLVPFPVAAVLSTALVCALPAVWVCQRKSVSAEAPSEPLAE